MISYEGSCSSFLLNIWKYFKYEGFVWKAPKATPETMEVSAEPEAPAPAEPEPAEEPKEAPAEEPAAEEPAEPETEAKANPRRRSE